MSKILEHRCGHNVIIAVMSSSDAWEWPLWSHRVGIVCEKQWRLVRYVVSTRRWGVDNSTSTTRTLTHGTASRRSTGLATGASSRSEDTITTKRQLLHLCIIMVQLSSDRLWMLVELVMTVCTANDVVVYCVSVCAGCCGKMTVVVMSAQLVDSHRCTLQQYMAILPASRWLPLFHCSVHQLITVSLSHCQSIDCLTLSTISIISMNLLQISLNCAIVSCNISVLL